MLEQLPHYLGNSPEDQMPGPSNSGSASLATKYNHLPDSQFKKNFLRSLTETIDSKIERLLKTHSVCLNSSQFFVLASLKLTVYSYNFLGIRKKPLSGYGVEK